MKVDKKGAIQEIQALIVPLVGVAIVLVVGFLIFAETKTQLYSIQGCTSHGSCTGATNGTAAWNATTEIQNAMQDIPGWLPIIIITVIGAILLGLVAYFRGR